MDPWTLDDELSLRSFQEGDGPGNVALVASVYAEYGDICEPEGFDKDLVEVQATYLDGGGMFSVLVNADNQVCGTVAVTLLKDQRCALKRLYLAKSLRGGGRGRALLEFAMSWAKDSGRTEMELWSDVRFEQAHALYLRLGFKQGQGTRTLADINKSVEYPFSRSLLDWSL